MGDNKKETLSHYQIASAAHKQKEAKSKEYEERSKKRLSNIVSTKMNTSFIGAISSCENHFGFLWGHGKSEEELTQDEIEMREVWDEIRAEILDNGNTQLRAAVNEIGNYSVSWDRYTLTMNTHLT